MTGLGPFCVVFIGRRQRFFVLQAYVFVCSVAAVGLTEMSSRQFQSRDEILVLPTDGK